MKDGVIFIDDYDLSIEIDTGGITEYGGRYSVQLIFVLNHPYFDEELVESCAGIGESKKEAAEMCIENFCTSVLLFIMGALKCECEEEISTEIMGKESTFRLPCCVKGVSHSGQPVIENTDLWDLVESEIPSYLGRKKAYWIKFFVAYTGDKIISEVRINNIVHDELTEKLTAAVPKPEGGIQYSSYKQFILLIQKESTYAPCPYTKEEAQHYAEYALRKMLSADSPEKAETVKEEIRAAIPCEQLADEIIAFVPEIFCSFLMDLKTGDSIAAMNGSSGKMTELRTSQVRSYSYIEDMIHSYLSRKMPSRKEVMNILGMSSIFNALNQAKENGADPKNLRFSGIVYMVREGYGIL